MGELMGGITHDQENFAATQSPGTDEPGKVLTGIDNVFADGVKDNMPIFSVDKEDFFNNMKVGRRRLRFKPETSAAKFLKGSRYNSPFYIQYKGEDGHFMRKIK